MSSPSTDFDDYQGYIKEYYPKTNFCCTKQRGLIIDLFKLIEIIDVYLNHFYELNNKNSEYLLHLRHQCLLILFNLPNYNTYFISSIQRNLAETVLKLTLLCIANEKQGIESINYSRLQKEIKSSLIYSNNNYELKRYCDVFFSYFGKESQIIHNNINGKHSNVQYIKSFNISPSQREFSKLSTFINNINSYMLITFPQITEIDDMNLSLSNKISLKKLIGPQKYTKYFTINKDLINS